MPEPRTDLTALLARAHTAIAQARDVEAVRLLQQVLERDPDNLHAEYLLAIQHAQVGLYERAEQRLRVVLGRMPEFVVARFQLAQLLLMRGTGGEASLWLAPVLDAPAPLGDYARALHVAAGGETARACRLIEAAQRLPQPIPELAADMRRLLAQWRTAAA
ncbi:tetratricopeptide repeat protein [Lysobacter firmicutimachus]|uniref:Tetratricopeptide repeat protein n=1 Tax=Lysobacter firmicutimachus TaxID=1792846 RepID=A0AAU8MUJ3_9GAMM|nr:tetratricopeptide repeat protein [Lysobacter antibioticus]